MQRFIFTIILTLVFFSPFIINSQTKSGSKKMAIKLESQDLTMEILSHQNILVMEQTFHHH